MNVNKSHKKSPRKEPASKPIERVPLTTLIGSIKEDIAREIAKVETPVKPKPKKK